MRYRILLTSVGYRIYDYQIFDIIKVGGNWYLEKDRDKAQTYCHKLNQ